MTSLCFLAILDTQKTFDVVHHTILLDKLIDNEIQKEHIFESQKDIWLIIRDLYSHQKLNGYEVAVMIFQSTG